MATFIPFFIALLVTSILYKTVGWWGFLVIFPWIGASISLGRHLQGKLPKGQKDMGRRISILLISPVFLLFLPIFNKENLQLEGIVFLLLVGYFSKGVIHYAIAKVFGPLIWGRGFCGWACWTAAVLDWLPVKKEGRIPDSIKNFRIVPLVISIMLPLMLVFVFSYDVRRDYLYKQEMLWMIAGNAVYYVLGIPLAFWLKDRRAFCKVACPVSLIMKIPASVSLARVKPTKNKCVQCGQCNKNCPMDVDVMGYISQGEKVRDTECILCLECSRVCPVKAI
ncbi:4Fe-4S binding protein [Heliobacterium chlorum]|uniref:4Fe-4S binding protein n=1 Tax=Heliobacterium chlorum TaxID=2698 RepID=A0ABR7T823_HELCL|nr:4Fe-4S dicluster domain-containing protein [Heliobacterium chlorum]MBC9786130.1 4Fe-4S binding protein [Heliobacterium chlorum]